MSSFLKNFCFCCVVACVAACGGGTSSDFDNPTALAIDSINDRVFVFESNQNIHVRTASTNKKLPDQPVLNSDDDADADLLDLVPQLTTQAVAYADGDETRLFLLGAHSSSSGTVLNQMTVLDFDGEDLSEAAFSPVTLTDGDEATDETQAVFVKMILDQDAGLIYILNSTTAEIFTIDATTGEAVGTPIAVAAEPVDMALLGTQLFVCHADADLADSVTVVNTDDDSLQTVTLGSPCQKIAVAQNDNGTVLAVRSASAQTVFLNHFNSDDLSLTPIATDEEGFTDGQLLSGAGITSSVSALVLTANADATISGYFAELDGNVEFVTIAADLSEFSHEKFSTTAINYSDGAALLNDDGESSHVYFIADTGFLLSLENQDGDLDGELDH